MVDATGARLHSLGVRAGDSVALVIDNRAEFVAIKLAVARLGAIAVPVNFSYRTAELRAVLVQSQASILISIEASIGMDRLQVLDELLPGWEHGSTVDELPALREILLVRAESGTSGQALGAVLSHDMVQRGAYGSAYHRGFADGWRIGSCDLVRYCRENLAGFKVPRGVTFIGADELPMTTTGKVRKYQLIESWAGDR